MVIISIASFAFFVFVVSSLVEVFASSIESAIFPQVSPMYGAYVVGVVIFLVPLTGFLLLLLIISCSLFVSFAFVMSCSLSFHPFSYLLDCCCFDIIVVHVIFSPMAWEGVEEDVSFLFLCDWVLCAYGW